MNFETSSQASPEHERPKEVLDDNARKFITETFEPAFLEEHGAVSFTLTTDWLETGEDNEKKLAHKIFKNGDIEFLLISKVTDEDGKRTSKPKRITQKKYKELLSSSILRVKKERSQFTYNQGGVVLSVKYDEFANSERRILEVDAPTDAERDSFNPSEFPYALSEVTGDIHYYGYRVAAVI